ncbi:MAG TPA: GNAT family N-acetyltransferase [Phycisphaerae bacterium]|nr:GNAT family N-acetyltransferase [Phycisphaerae bacterium]
MTQKWQERYADKLVAPAAAMKHVRPGDRVFMGSACGEPQELVRALVQAGGNLSDTELIQVLTLGVAPYADPKYSSSFRANAFFIGNSLRNAVNDARADYTPVFLSKVSDLLQTRRIPIDVALIMVNPPDEHGFCSLGVSVDITKTAAEVAKVVIAQVNRHMPRTLGDCFLHVDQIDYFVEHDEPLLEWPVVTDADQTTERIANHIARLVPDGATIQMGIGRVPDAVLSLLVNKNDLGIHTEMFSDSVMSLVDAGVITGRRKTLHPGKIVASFAAGSQAFFEWLNDNPEIEMRPSQYTNDPRIICRHDNMIAINAGIEVDLTGQVVADSIGTWFYSGVGGHADFIRGAALAKNGKPIIAMPSTAETKDGIRSRLVSTLAEGAGVTTTRGDTHYVVTEYGVAYLHGRNLRERAMALLNVAHPDFRSELLHKAKQRRIVYPNQILPPTNAPYPSQYEWNVTLKDSRTVFIRPIRPEDEPMMKDMFYSFSERTRYLRFHGPMKSFPHARLQVFCNVDYDQEMTLIGVVGQPGEEDVVALGCYIHDQGTNTAEVAFSVRDDWQNKGLGSILFRKLVDIGRERSIDVFHAEVLTENLPMLNVFHHSGCTVSTQAESGVVHVTIQLSPVKTKPAVKA